MRCENAFCCYLTLRISLDPALRRKSRRHSSAARSEQSSAPDLRVISNGPTASVEKVMTEDQQLSKQMSNSSPELDVKARRRQLRRQVYTNFLLPRFLKDLQFLMYYDFMFWRFTIS